MEPLVPLAIFTLKPPAHSAIPVPGFFKEMFLPNRGPNTDTKAGFSNSAISDQEKFMSSARKNPLIPTVGVKPKPNVVASKLALVFRLVICFQPLLSGNQTPASMAVDVFDRARICLLYTSPSPRDS